MTINQLKSNLQSILNQYPNTIKAHVAQEALDYHCPKAFFEDLFQYGCQSGMIPSLIYYSDTHAFFQTHYDEIEDIRQEYEYMTGQPIKITGDLMNDLAWFTFEYTASQIYSE